MSTILMAVLIIAFTVILPWMLIARHKKAQRKKELAGFRRFSQAGSERNLAFSRQEIIQNKIIGFDGIQQVLMVIEMENEYNITCIAIKELAQCRVDKIYFTYEGPGGDKEKILKEIGLVFYFIDDRTPLSILFYSNKTDSIYQMAEMEAKAKEWQQAVSGLITQPQLAK